MIVALIIIYAVIGLATIRPAAGHFAWKKFYRDKQKYYCLYDGQTEPDDWFDAYAGAILMAFIWPTYLITTLASKYPIGAEKQAQLEAEIKARDKRDKELGLEPYEYGRITK